MTTDVPTSDGTSGDSGGDAIAVFTALRPSVAAPSADDLDAMRRAAFAAGPQCAVLPTESAEVAQPILVPATADRPRLRLGVALLAAAAIVATLAIAVRPDRRTTPIGPGTTGSAPASNVPAPPSSAPTTTGPTPAASASTTATTGAANAPSGTTFAAPVDPTPPAPLVLPNERIDPLTAFFSGTENGARLRKASLAGQPDVAECMQARGWQYTQLTIRDVYDPVSLLRARDPDEFRRRYGYGVTTIVSSALSYSSRDPNEPYLATLTDEQAAAWRTDLEGNGDRHASPAQRASCYQSLYDQIAALAKGVPTADIGVAAFDPRYDATLDPRVQAATEAWRACLARAGPDLRPLMGPEAVLQRKQDALVRAANAAWDPQSNVLPTIDPVAVQALQDEERHLAALDHQCNLDAGLAASQLAASTEIAAALRERFPEVVVEPYDPNLR